MKEHRIPLSILTTLVITVELLNTVPHTVLSGWDNVQTELNPLLNLFRAVFGTWQEYQGLGLPAGMGHPADIVHAIEILLLSSVFPQHLVRYIWTFFMLYTGMVGIYALTYYLSRRRDTALLAAIAYLGNLATIQTFYTPLEVFSSQYAFLPWMLLTSIICYEYPTSKNFFLLCCISILGSPQGYVQTVWVVSFGAVFLLLLMLWIQEKTWDHAKRVSLILALFLLTNAFWLLPFFYFVSTHAQTVVQAKINQMADTNIFLQNKEFGHLWDVAQLKGFWFNNVDPNTTGGYSYMMSLWKDHTAQPLVLIVLFLSFFISIFGAIQAAKSKQPIFLAFALLLGISITLLTTATPPFSWINELLRLLPLFSQAYRFPFTKFSILAGLLYSLFFALGTTVITERKLPHFLRKISFGVWILFPLFIAFPVFTGHLFYAKEHASIPQDYFQTINFFSQQPPTERIADFPQYTYWGWNEYKWGNTTGSSYGGSGFIWYGISQPILDRAFDPWSSYDENYYWELSSAINADNPHTLETVLGKYDVTWVLLDTHIYDPQVPLVAKQQKQLLSRVNGLTHVKTFGGIEIYHVSNSPHIVTLAPSLPQTAAPAWNDRDILYQTLGDYIETSTPSVYFPFASLFSQKTTNEETFSLSQTPTTITLSTPIPQSLIGKTLTLSQKPPDNLGLQIYPPSFISTVAFSGTIRLLSTQENNRLSVTMKKNTDMYQHITINPTDHLPPTNCDQFRKGPIDSTHVGSEIRIASTNATACISYKANYLPHNLSYALFITTQHLQGKPLHVWVSDDILHTAVIDTYLPENTQQTTTGFILPPLEEHATSYTIHIDNQSIGSDTSINELGTITLYPIPYSLLKNIYIGTIPQHTGAYSLSLPFRHPNPSIYTVDLSNKPENLSTLVLSQAYDPAWEAYTLPMVIPSGVEELFPFLFGKRLHNHDNVDGWKNGWIMDQNTTQTYRIIIIYLPQYLEYGGIMLSGGIWVWLLLQLLRQRHREHAVK